MEISTKQRRRPRVHWKLRPVAVIAMATDRTLHLIRTEMMIRIKSENADGSYIFEGPVRALWKSVCADHQNLARLDFIGVLAAADDALNVGRIDWIEEAHQASLRGKEFNQSEKSD